MSHGVRLAPCGRRNTCGRQGVRPSHGMVSTPWHPPCASPHPPRPVRSGWRGVGACPRTSEARSARHGRLASGVARGSESVPAAYRARNSLAETRT